MIHNKILTKKLHRITLLAAVFLALVLLVLAGWAYSNRQVKDLESLKSLSIEEVTSRINAAPETPYELIYDVGQRVDVSEPPIDWSKNFDENRSLNFYLHSWDMLNTKLIEYDDKRNLDNLAVAYDTAVDWARNNEVSYINNQDENFAWYDMAVGIRAYRLAYIFDQAVRADLGSNEEHKILWDSIVDHLLYLDDDENIIFHNNHGVYQAAGQKALARRFMEVSDQFTIVQSQADDRLERMLKQQFTSEGIHKEHSPDYHRMVYGTFQTLSEEGLLNGENDELIASFKEALYWMTKPDGILVNFGDSDYRVMPAGQIGSPENSLPLKVYSDSGFAAVKQGTSYMAQQAAFFSRTHKHADDLTFSWYEGRDILIDSGKYGYKVRTDPSSQDAEDGFWYADKRRQYVESTRAHNVVEIDGMDYLRRGREPFGSAIIDSGKVAGNTYYVRTKVSQFETIDYERLLIYTPGEWLVVLDDLDDRESKTRDYTQWFQFAPDLDVANQRQELIVRGLGERALTAISLVDNVKVDDPIRGQQSPRLQGWYSKNANHFVPTTSSSFSQSGNGAEFATLFMLDGPVSVDVEKNNLNKISWRSGSKSYTLEINLSQPSDTRISYEVK